MSLIPNSHVDTNYLNPITWDEYPEHRSLLSAVYHWRSLWQTSRYDTHDPHDCTDYRRIMSGYVIKAHLHTCKGAKRVNGGDGLGEESK